MRRLAGVLGTVALACAALANSGAARATASFATGVLPADPASGLDHNRDAEPGIAAAPDGTLWATALYGVTGEGQDVWRSSDGGRSWDWVAAPFNTNNQDSLIAGDDADIAVATEPNALGSFNVYTASLWGQNTPAGLLVGDISLAVSIDNGTTWVTHPLAAEVPLDDRPWLAADGPCRVYLSYHAGPTVANVVNMYDLCDPIAAVEGVTLTPVAATRYPDLLVPAATGQRSTYVTVGFGKIVVDTSAASPYRHTIYIPMADCPELSLDDEIVRAEAAEPNCPSGTNAHLFVASSPDAGVTWSFHDIAASSSNAVPIWPATAAVSNAGGVYVAWHDNHNAFIQSSNDGGNTWSAPLRVNATGTAVYPTIATAAGNVVDVAWYGTEAIGDSNDASTMGSPGAPTAAVWSLRWARSHDGGVTFDPPVTVDPVIHTGVLCTRGVACSIPNSRDLLDDFGAITDPISGRAAIVYTSDQPTGTRDGRAIHYAAQIT